MPARQSQQTQLVFYCDSCYERSRKRASRPLRSETNNTNNKMKKAFFLCAVISAALILGSCANRTTTTTTRTDSRGLVSPGSVAPVSGGPSRPGQVKQRFQP